MTDSDCPVCPEKDDEIAALRDALEDRDRLIRATIAALEAGLT